MNAKLLLINAGPTGTETLKNLVLPAVGHFTVLDANTTSESDCANNFFVAKEHVGKPRAAVVTEMLLEMNGDCAGDFRYVLMACAWGVYEGVDIGVVNLQECVAARSSVCPSVSPVVGNCRLSLYLALHSLQAQHT
jgi:hypothetical protein